MQTKTLRKGNHRYGKRAKNYKRVNNGKTEKGRNECKLITLYTWTKYACTFSFDVQKTTK